MFEQIKECSRRLKDPIACHLCGKTCDYSHLEGSEVLNDQLVAVLVVKDDLGRGRTSAGAKGGDVGFKVALTASVAACRARKRAVSLAS